MKVLVDTSVWVDHLRSRDQKLVQMLSTNDVVIHEDVIGELSCGNLQNRSSILKYLTSLPQIPSLQRAKVLASIKSRNWSGKGIGLIDATLLQSVIDSQDCKLWTRDKRLNALAKDAGVAFDE